jgi:hypothetical protein
MPVPVPISRILWTFSSSRGARKSLFPTALTFIRCVMSSRSSSRYQSFVSIATRTCQQRGSSHRRWGGHRLRYNNQLRPAERHRLLSLTTMPVCVKPATVLNRIVEDARAQRSRERFGAVPGSAVPFHHKGLHLRVGQQRVGNRVLHQISAFSRRPSTEDIDRYAPTVSSSTSSAGPAGSAGAGESVCGSVCGSAMFASGLAGYVDFVFKMGRGLVFREREKEIKPLEGATFRVTNGFHGAPCYPMATRARAAPTRASIDEQAMASTNSGCQMA